MRRLTISFVLVAIAISISAQDLDKILTDHYKAAAQDKISKITSIVTKGNAVSMGMETGITLYQARPNKLRMEAEMMGSKMIQTFNGTTGWVYAPAMGIAHPQEMGADDLKSVIEQAIIDSPLWDYEARGKSVELVGTTEDGSGYKIKLTDSAGDAMIICISKETSLLSNIIVNQVINGTDAEIEFEFKDYKNVKGIPTAHYMATKMSGQTMSTMTFESIEYNKDLDASLFEKPVVE
jgi:outer membrane lipoprotein-sorting protein